MEVEGDLAPLSRQILDERPQFNARENILSPYSSSNKASIPPRLEENNSHQANKPSSSFVQVQDKRIRLSSSPNKQQQQRDASESLEIHSVISSNQYQSTMFSESASHTQSSTHSSTSSNQSSLNSLSQTSGNVLVHRATLLEHKNAINNKNVNSSATYNHNSVNNSLNYNTNNTNNSINNSITNNSITNNSVNNNNSINNNSINNNLRNNENMQPKKKKISFEFDQNKQEPKEVSFETHDIMSNLERLNHQNKNLAMLPRPSPLPDRVFLSYSLLFLFSSYPDFFSFDFFFFSCY